MTGDDLTAAREAGRRAAEQAITEQAPTEPLLKVAWTRGHGGVDAVEAAVHEAREAGHTWPEITQALGETKTSTVRVRYTQHDRWAKYIAKKRGDS
jgi:hypothetical protein